MDRICNWRSYKNGNTITTINIKTGTKIHETINPSDDFEFAFSESCDVNISNKCDGGCPWCYQGCTPTSSHGDLLSPKFLDTLHPYTELAINGNDMSHPDLVPFLERMKKKNILVSMTVNQRHFLRHLETIRGLLALDLIKGIGISLIEPTDEFIEVVKGFPTAVIHTIAGILTKEQLDKLADNNLKLLILGYKTMKNRGKTYYEDENNKNAIDNGINWLSNNLKDYMNKFAVVSFDNLSLKQLNVRAIIGEEKWKAFYQGGDGTFTFYIDLVEKKFAKSSISDVKYDLLESIDEMFEVIKNEDIKKQDVQFFGGTN